LNLSHNQLVNFNGIGSNKLCSLENLNLSNIKIRSIPEYTFNDFKNLVSLDLSKNEIKSTLYKCFIGLDNFLGLNLTKNSISFVSANALQGCLKLVLDLKKIFGCACNKYNCIYCGSCSNRLCENPIIAKNLRLMPNKAIVFDDL
jgi:Leucine-rich repeat (LRR) protein